MDFALSCFFVFIVAICCLLHSRAEQVNEPQTEAELESLRRSVTRSQP